MKGVRSVCVIPAVACALLVCTCLQVKAHESDCYGGHWELVESTQDTWTVPGNQGYLFYGSGPFWFWEKPTSCSSTVLDSEGFMIEYSKTLVCVPPSQIVYIAVPRKYDCTITGKAKVQDYYSKTSNDPCLYFSGMYHSWFGNLTTAYKLKKYKRIYPQDSFPQNSNLGLRDSCS